MQQATAGSAPEGARSGGRLSWLRENGLHVYVTASVAVGMAVFLFMAARAVELTVEPWRLMLVVALCVFADLPLLETRIGHNLESFTFAELCIVLSVAIVPTEYGVVIAASCVFLFHVARRIAHLKAAFNAANFALGAGAATTAAHAVGGRELASFSLENVAALTLATLVFFLVNSGGVALAVALSQRVRFTEVYKQGLGIRLLVAFGNGGIGIGILGLADWSRSTLMILPPVFVLMYASYRGYLHAAQERDIWQQLESATRELNQLDEKAVISAAVSRAAQMLKAHSVTLELRNAGGSGSTTFVGDGDGLRDASSVDDDAFASVEEDADTQMVYAAALEGPQGRIGVLRLCFSGPVQLSKRERQVLKTFAHSVSTTLQNARLYSEMRSHAEAKAYEAAHDALTGLGNRVLLHDRAVTVLEDAVDDWQCALLIIDLDHFKEINDTLGHAAGDVFLQQVGNRIASSVKQADAVCRLGGDEFAVLISGLRTPEHADAVAARLLEVLAQPVEFDGLRLSIEGSVGVACYPADASSFDELMRRADVALYQAKTSRGSFSHYRVDRDESSLHRLELAAQLRTALAEDQLVVHFQPQFDLQTGHAVGAEALVRWQHPRRGLLAPAEFVGAVEHSGLIRDFTMTVLEKAVAECATWTGGGASLTVAVNLSARNLLDSELPVDVGRILLKHGLPAERLVLEITETTMMSELEVVEEVLGTLRTMGIQISVDDFGTGYSSLAFLQRVAVNEVKIDRSFVAGLSGSESDRALVRATVQLAHSLGARAVGEGVEDEQLAKALRELGCDFAQGYHLGRPMPADELRTKLGLRQRKPLGMPKPRPEVDGRHLRAVAAS
jgi:diguanylate cyclase (GGDEF)-like protein